MALILQESQDVRDGVSPSDVDGEITGFLEYSTELFEESTVTKLLDDFAHALKDLTDPADLAELPDDPGTGPA